MSYIFIYIYETQTLHEVLKNYIAIICLLFVFTNISGQTLQVNPSQSAQALAETISGQGVTVSNATLNCTPRGSGLFNGTTSNIGLGTGVILATGHIDEAITNLGQTINTVIGPNNSPSAGIWVNQTTPFADADLATIIPNTLYDGCVLEFDVVPLGNSLSFRYVFASEEYPEYVCSDYNDVFAFFISGPGIVGKRNIALIPGTTIPVAINSVNSGQRGSSCGLIPLFCTCTSLAYGNLYVDNTNGTSVQYDGFTTTLTAETQVTACETYRLKLVIADAGDGVYDSGVFIEEASLNSNIPVVIQSTGDVFEGCRDGFIDFGIASPSASPTTIRYVIGGTATNGVDYVQIPDSVVIPAGQTTVRLDIVTIPDTIDDPIETVELYLYTLVCDTLFYDTVVVTIIEDVPVLNAQDVTICRGEQAQLQVGGGVTYEWIPPVNLTNPNIPNPVFIGDTTTGYIIVTTDTNNCRGRGFLTVYVLDPPNPIYDPIYNICTGDTAQLSVTGGANYSWSPATGLSNANIGNPKAFPLTTTNYTVTVSVGNCTETAQITVNVSNAPTISVRNDTTVCRGTTVQLNASGGNTYTWSPANTLSNPNVSNPIATITATTTYNVTVSSGIGCSATGSVNITATDPLPISAGNDVLKCIEDTVTLTASGGTTYTWSPNVAISDINIASPQVFPTTDILYTVSSIDINGCPTADSVLVSIIQVQPVNAGLDQSICLEGSVSIGGNPTADNSAVVTWTSTTTDVNNLSSTTTQNPVFNAAGLPAGSYTFQVVATQQGCDAGSDEVTIFVNPNPEANIAGLNSLYCLEGSGSTLTGIPPGGTFSGLGISGNSFNPASAGLNNFIEIAYAVTDANGCYDDTIQITQVVNYTIDAGEDKTIAVFESIELTPSSGAVVYQWSPQESLSCADCMNPVASPTITTTYNLIAIDENGCVATDNVTVNVFVDTLLWVPNAFSPNGDGENDVFRIYGKSIKSIEFQVFNRWGELIFYTTDPNEGWDGTYKGEKMNPGVYVFVVKATFINDLESRREKGSFILVR